MKSPLGTCKGAGETWEISLLSSQFCHEPKTALKNKVLKKYCWLLTFFFSHTNMKVTVSDISPFE